LNLVYFSRKLCNQVTAIYRHSW